MEILQLGNGGGLSVEKTNSSFLIKLDNDRFLLFDCGCNIPERLIQLEKEENNNGFEIAKIKYVFISHIHDDHIGGLETLIFYNYFHNNIVMDILYPNSSVKAYIDLKMPDKLFSGSRIVNKTLYNDKQIEKMYRIVLGNTKYSIKALINTFHGPTESNGLILIDRNTESTIIITGDTKASESLENEIKREVGKDANCLIFHDYSFWDCPSKQVHACETDFEDEYSDKFKEKVIKYHTGTDDFNKEWQTL